MSENTPQSDQPNNGFFINQGTLSGRFTTPGGEHYTIKKLEPREVTDPRDGSVTTIWGGYAAARDLARAAKDAQLQTRFNKTGERPADLFAPEFEGNPALRHVEAAGRQRLHPHRFLLEFRRQAHHSRARP